MQGRGDDADAEQFSIVDNRIATTVGREGGGECGGEAHFFNELQETAGRWRWPRLLLVQLRCFHKPFSPSRLHSAPRGAKAHSASERGEEPPIGPEGGLRNVGRRNSTGGAGRRQMHERCCAEPGGPAHSRPEDGSRAAAEADQILPRQNHGHERAHCFDPIQFALLLHERLKSRRNLVAQHAHTNGAVLRPIQAGPLARGLPILADGRSAEADCTLTGRANPSGRQ